MVALFVKIPMM